MADFDWYSHDIRMIGAVLAGGKSSRMGQDKSLLQLGGKTLLERSIDTLQGAQLLHICISGDKPQFADLCQVSDIYPNCGPLGALHALMVKAQQLECDGLICVAVDMPLVSTGELHKLIESSLGAGQSAYYLGHPLPCVVNVSARHIEIAEEILQGNGNLSLRHFYQRIGCKAIVADFDDSILFNANTPEDWQNLPRLTGVKE